MTAPASAPDPTWFPEPPIARDTAALLIESSFPDVDTTELRHLGSGWLYNVFATADDWVFRFPRWNWSGVFDQEARIHEFVGKILPSRIRLPRVELLAPPSPRFPYPFAGHRFVPGIGVDEADDALLPTLAREIGVFLGILHSTPLSVAAAAGVRELVIDEGRREWFHNGVILAARMRGQFDAVVDRAIDWVQTIPHAPAYTGPLHFTHGSLEPEHVLVDPATGILAGVLEWTDPMLSDSAGDFVFVVTWKGWQLLEEVLRHYPLPVDRDFRTRLRFGAQMMSIIGLAFLHDDVPDPTKMVRAVHHAFGTE
jgi:aminoglycoside phosphotransferase (APT) family kinase protein